MDAFDADVLIFAATPGHVLGRRVRALLPHGPMGPTDPAGTGSVLLVLELLSKPLRDGATDEVDTLVEILSRLDLRPVDRSTANVATVLGAKYRLRAADATHLASAVVVGADRFITNNHRDFPTSIEEIDVVYAADLPDLSRPERGAGS
ncbi:MAG TPA: PIN domain-containing protein [Kribbellaceae bacterium]|nr:PIN domain-containing protein [Kribbellaceae bacterium]